jgi:hypothetical protein
MEELAGWKPFRNVDPSMTQSTFEDAVNSVESWLRDVQKLKEGQDYLKRAAGAWTEFYVREERYEALLQAYVAHIVQKAGGEAEFNVKNSFKYPASHKRGLGK